MTDLSWSFSKVWNESLARNGSRVLKPRSHIWASELGGAYIDRFLKMRGEVPSNPPDARSRRKFEAGNMMEWVVEMVLKRAGVLIDKQEWVEHQYDGLPRVTGKLDHLAGGKPDWNKAKEEVKALDLPDFFDRAIDAVISHFKSEYSDGLNEIILEIKSCSSFMYDYYKNHGANENHQLQIYHYLKSKRLPEGHIVYISKDDLRMLEVGVFLGSRVEEHYIKDISTLADYLYKSETPPKEKEIAFNENDKKFSRNWKVGYSSYLTKLYKYESQGDFEDAVKGRVARWNRVITRMKNGKPMTGDNLAAIEEMKEFEPDIESIVSEEEK